MEISNINLVCLHASHPGIIVQCMVGRKQELQRTVQVPECLDFLKAFQTLLSTRHMKILLAEEPWSIQSVQSVT